MTFELLDRQGVQKRRSIRTVHGCSSPDNLCLKQRRTCWIDEDSTANKRTFWSADQQCLTRKPKGLKIIIFEDGAFDILSSPLSSSGELRINVILRRVKRIGI